MKRSRWLFVAPLLFAAALASSCAQAADEAGRYYEDALVRFERKDDAGAIIQLKNALKADPGMLAAHMLMGRSALRKGDYAAAEVALREAQRRGAARAEYVLPLGQLLLDLGRQKELVDTLQSGDLPPGVRLELLMLRARAYMELNQIPPAQQTLDDARLLDPRSVGVVVMQSRLALLAGRRDEAARLAEQATSMNPADSGAWAARGSFAYLQGMLPLALSHFDRAVQLKPDNSEAQLGRGSVLMDLGRIEEAKVALQQLAKVDPGDPRSAYLRAVIASMQSRPDEARKLLSDVVNLIDPAPRGVLTTRAYLALIAGLSHQSLGATTKAKEYFELYIRFFPNQAGARKPLAAIYLAEGDPARAIATLEPIVKSGVRDPDALSLMASAYGRMKKHQKASEYLEEATKIVDSPQIQTSLGLSLLGARQTEAGVDQLRKVLLRDPGQPAAGMALALTALREQQPAKAITLIGQVLKREPGNLAALNLAGVAYAAAGDFPAARVAYEKAIAGDPRFDSAQLNLAKLDVVEKRFDDARQRLTAILQRRALHKDALYELALLDIRQRRTDDARRNLESLHEKHGDHFEGQQTLIDLYLESGEMDKALALAKESSPNRPGYLAIQAALVRVYLARGDTSAARVVLNGMTRAAEFDPTAQYKIARLQLMAANPTGARYSLEKALQGDPGFVLAKALIGELDLSEGALDKADARVKPLLNLPSAPAQVYRLAGDVAATRNEWQTAITHYRTALARGEGIDTANRLYRAYAAAGQRKQGANAIEAIARERAEDVAFQLLLAEIQAESGQLPQARATLQALLKFGENPVVLNNLANVQWRLKDPLALQTAEKAYRLAPGEAIVIDTLGWILAKSGKLDAGLKHLREARLRDSANPEIRFHLAWALAQSGKKGEARAELAEALASTAQFSGIDDARSLQAELAGQ